MIDVQVISNGTVSIEIETRGLSAYELAVQQGFVGTLAEWLATIPMVNFITREVPTGIINGINATFTLANIPILGSESIFLEGLLQNLGTDYTISGLTITMLNVPQTNDILLVSYMK